MEGKGWFIIYGLLLFFCIYLFLAQRELSGQLQELRNMVSAQDVEGTEPVESAAPEPIASASPTPDLTSPEARDLKRKNDLHTIKTALFAYNDENKRYPTDLSELNSPDLAILPSDPLAPKYRYRYRKTDKGFLLTCFLEQKDDPDDKKSDGKSDQVYTLSEKSR